MKYAKNTSLGREIQMKHQLEVKTSAVKSLGFFFVVFSRTSVWQTYQKRSNKSKHILKKI